MLCNNDTAKVAILVYWEDKDQYKVEGGKEGKGEEGRKEERLFDPSPVSLPSSLYCNHIRRMRTRPARLGGAVTDGLTDRHAC